MPRVSHSLLGSAMLTKGSLLLHVGLKLCRLLRRPDEIRSLETDSFGASSFYRYEEKKASSRDEAFTDREV
ncbi:MAG: hypothetical protein ACT4O9_16805 [Blastocatellia bacterium]